MRTLWSLFVTLIVFWIMTQEGTGFGFGWGLFYAICCDTRIRREGSSYSFDNSAVVLAPTLYFFYWLFC